MCGCSWWDRRLRFQNKVVDIGTSWVATAMWHPCIYPEGCNRLLGQWFTIMTRVQTACL